MKKVILLLAFLNFSLFVKAQYHQPVYSSIEGQELLTLLEDNYRPNFTPASNQARDILYGQIYNVNGFVSCVYTGFTVNLPAGEDPSSAVFAQGINAEHTMPNSLLDGSNHNFDLHNLYPTRVEVNSDRGNFPFTDIADGQTNRWYFLDQEQSAIPSNNIDLYSEWVNGFFEPREDHKGNVARAMMYTYAVYGDAIDNNNEDFFELQRQTLCNWHIQDPVDEVEYNRTYQIASYQSNIPNPFVMDCTLASRSFCLDMDLECVLPPTSAVEDLSPGLGFTMSAQTVFSDKTTITYTVEEALDLRLSIYNAQGQLISVLINERKGEGVYSIDYSSNDAKGLLLVVAEWSTKKVYKIETLKLIGH